MKFHHLVEHVVQQKKQKNLSKGKGAHLFWWQLLFIGIGSIVGAGFFLGTGLSIKTAGPSILVGYLIAGITAYFVFSALAEMSVYDPQEGSFRAYAKKAFGHSLGFASGWMYWISGILIMSSEIVALSTFTRFWPLFSNVPLWVLSLIYALLGLSIILKGVSDFGKVESFFATIKLSTLVIFIIFGVLFLSGLIKAPQETNYAPGVVFSNFFPKGFSGFWAALIFIFFSFGGIAVVGVASSEIKNKENIPKTGKFLLTILLTVYLLSLYSVLKIVSYTKITAHESPFVTALTSFKIPYIDSIFNIIIITAAFSTMVGALFSITNILLALSDDKDAPQMLGIKNERGVPTRALILSAMGVGVSIILSSILPSIYEYITTAAGIMLILNWVIILLSHLRLHKEYLNANLFKIHKYHMFGYPYTSYIAIFFIIFTISGAAINPTQRYSLFVTAGLVLLVFLSYLIHIHTTKQMIIQEKVKDEK